MEQLLHVDAHYCCAGAVFVDGRCVRAAPILGWMQNQRAWLDNCVAWAERMGHGVQVTQTTRIIIAGSRKFNNYPLLEQKMNRLTERLDFVEVVSGTAMGADRLGEQWATSKRYPIKRFPADWSQGKGAGFTRNAEMAEYAHCLVAFWDGVSRGTRHMIDTANDRGLNVRVVSY